MTHHATTVPARPTARISLHAVTAAVVGVVGYLLFALSEEAPARTAGLVLLAAAVLSAAAAVQALRTRDAAGLGLAAGAAAVVAGVATVVLLAVAGSTATSDLLLAGALPLALGGASTAAALVDRRRWTSA